MRQGLTCKISKTDMAKYLGNYRCRHAQKINSVSPTKYIGCAGKCVKKRRHNHHNKNLITLKPENLHYHTKIFQQIVSA